MRRAHVIIVLPLIIVEAGWLALLAYAGLHVLAT
jgi:hypothetical protein